MPHANYGSVKVGDVDVFYREAGPKDGPLVLLLHGFPTSSHMFRDLIPALACRYHVIAPDLPGFGNTIASKRCAFACNFDGLADVMAGFTNVLGLDRFALYIFDYGAPVWLRLALKYPERISAIISQNGNAYLEGMSDGWGPFKAYWADPPLANREACREAALTDAALHVQYEHGAPLDRLSPEGLTLDIHYRHRPVAQEIRLDLILDYRTNLVLYPNFQRYFREGQPPFLAVWGGNDPYFIKAGAQAYRRDPPRAEVHLLDAGHFALQTHHVEIAGLMDGFLRRHVA